MSQRGGFRGWKEIWNDTLLRCVHVENDKLINFIANTVESVPQRVDTISEQIATKVDLANLRDEMATKADLALVKDDLAWSKMISPLLKIKWRRKTILRR
jgi:hypothetical protein